MSDKIPVFRIEDTAKKNFDKYNEYMRSAKTMDDVKRCRLTFEGYLKSCSILERELKRAKKAEEKAEISFEVA